MNTAVCKEIVSLIFFSYKPWNGKDEFNFGTGQQASVFREKCMRNFMHHVVRGIYKYGTIRKESVTELPKWILSIVPSAEAIRIVKSAEEKKGTDKVMKSRISNIISRKKKPDKLDYSVFESEA